jgi:uncharacterized protein (TIGR02453 family)
MKTILDFLIQLKDNNNREWFADNKKLYEDAKVEFEEFVNMLIPQIKAFDSSVDVNSAKECTFRIYKDVRFSKNKEPYKTNFGAHIVKGGKKSPNSGYYFHIQPGESFAGGGLYMPEPNVLKNIRQNIYDYTDSFLEIINDKKFINTFGEMWGDKLKTPPKGFPKDFEHVEILKHKSFVVSKAISDNQLLEKNIQTKIIDIFSVQYKFNSFFNSFIE